MFLTGARRGLPWRVAGRTVTDASRYAKLLSEAYFLTVLSSELEVL